MNEQIMKDEEESKTSVNLDALKFFHAYIQTLVELGGENLPKTISSQMGAKLAKLYKSRGISGIESSLKQSYDALNGRTSVKNIDENTLEITTEYPNNFCPIGGDFNPDRANLVQQCICYPYTTAFLNEIDPTNKYEGTVTECIIKSGKNQCRYSLKIESKNNCQNNSH